MLRRLFIAVLVLCSLHSAAQTKVPIKQVNVTTLTPVQRFLDSLSAIRSAIPSTAGLATQSGLQDTASAIRSRITAATALPTISALTYGATTTWDYSTQGTEAKVTLTGNTTLSITNLPAGVVYLTLEVIQDATGSRTITLPANTKVIGGGSGAVTLTTTGGAKDLLTFRWDGTTLFANLGTNYN